MRIVIEAKPLVVESVKIEINNVAQGDSVCDVGIFYVEAQDYVSIDAWRDGKRVGRRRVNAVELIALVERANSDD